MQYTKITEVNLYEIYLKNVSWRILSIHQNQNQNKVLMSGEKSSWHSL